MQRASSLAGLRRIVSDWRAGGDRIALVPTMGALHEGHLSLVRAAKDKAGRVVVSIFVNPKQFAPDEDFTRYPRRQAEDAALLQSAGADLLYLPDAETIYPPDYATTISLAGMSERWEGAIRPGHFDGVATIVARLLIQAAPDYALFGEKDYQQLQVIRRMTRDLDLPVEIIGCPIVRDAEGLALSSRNAYLTDPQLTIARTLNGVLRDAAGANYSRRGEAAGAAKSILLKNGFSDVDYFDFVDALTLAPAPPEATPARLIAAARISAVRLLDNCPVPHSYRA